MDVFVLPNNGADDCGLAPMEPNIGVVVPKPTLWLNPVEGVLFIKFCVCPNGVVVADVFAKP